MWAMPLRERVAAQEGHQPGRWPITQGYSRPCAQRASGATRVVQVARETRGVDGSDPQI